MILYTYIPIPTGVISLGFQQKRERKGMREFLITDFVNCSIVIIMIRIVSWIFSVLTFISILIIHYHLYGLFFIYNCATIFTRSFYSSGVSTTTTTTRLKRDWNVTLRFSFLSPYTSYIHYSIFLSFSFHASHTKLESLRTWPTYSYIYHIYIYTL